MSPNPRLATQGEALNYHRAFCDLVLEASEADVDETIRSLGESPEDIENRARQAWRVALSENNDNVVQLVDHRSPQNAEESNRVQRGFSLLMKLLRRKKEMEITEVALSAQVDPGELFRIETEPGYLPSPRTIFQLERFFELPKDTLSRLSGAIINSGDNFQCELLKFAACSDGMGKLSKDEKKLLNAFVRHLANRKRA